MKKKIVIICLILLLILSSSIIIHGRGTASSIRYITALATKGEITVSVNASGTVVAQKVENANFPVSGKVLEVDVKPGDKVTNGQQLAKLDVTNSTIATQLTQAENALQTAKNNLASAQANPSVSSYQLNNLQLALTTAQNNLTAGQTDPATTASQLSNLQNAVNTAQNNLSQAQQQSNTTQYSLNNLQLAVTNAEASYENALANYDNATLTSTIDGIVAGVNINSGDNISAGNSSTSTTASSSSQSTAQIQIIDPSSFAVSLQIPEADIAKIAVGQNAQLTFTALGDTSYVGTVASIAEQATTSSNVISYNVLLSLSKIDSALKLGMTANATIITQTKDNVITVPSTAVQSQNGQPTVQIMKNGVPTTVVVTTGLTNGTDTEITSGVNEGDTVITSTINPSAITSSTTSLGSGTGRGGFGGATRLF